MIDFRIYENPYWWFGTHPYRIGLCLSQEQRNSIPLLMDCNSGGAQLGVSRLRDALSSCSTDRTFSIKCCQEVTTNWRAHTYLLTCTCWRMELKCLWQFSYILMSWHWYEGLSTIYHVCIGLNIQFRNLYIVTLVAMICINSLHPLPLPLLPPSPRS
jgi:hypothetical protein